MSIFFSVQVACHSEMFQVANELMIIADGNELYIVDLEHLGFKSGKLRTIHPSMHADGCSWDLRPSSAWLSC